MENKKVNPKKDGNNSTERTINTETNRAEQKKRHIELEEVDQNVTSFWTSHVDYRSWGQQDGSQDGPKKRRRRNRRKQKDNLVLDRSNHTKAYGKSSKVPDSQGSSSQDFNPKNSNSRGSEPRIDTRKITYRRKSEANSDKKQNVQSRSQLTHVPASSIETTLVHKKSFEAQGKKGQNVSGKRFESTSNKHFENDRRDGWKDKDKTMDSIRSLESTRERKRYKKKKMQNEDFECRGKNFKKETENQINIAREGRHENAEKIKTPFGKYDLKDETINSMKFEKSIKFRDSQDGYYGTESEREKRKGKNIETRHRSSSESYNNDIKDYYSQRSETRGSRRKERNEYRRKHNMQSGPQPTHFLAFRIRNPLIHNMATEIQNVICNKNELYKPAFVLIPTLHVTLAVFALEDREQIDIAINSLYTSLDRLIYEYDKISDKVIKFDSMNSFDEEVLYIDLRKTGSLQLLHSIVPILRETLAEQNIEVEKRDFNPHATIMKLSRNPRKLKRNGITNIPEDLYAEYKNCYFGAEEFCEILLCSMMGKKTEDRFYRILATIDLKNKTMFRENGDPISTQGAVGSFPKDKKAKVICLTTSTDVISDDAFRFFCFNEADFNYVLILNRRI